MSRDEALADLAYVRTLAEEGRKAPLLGGAHLVGWGVLVSAAFVGHGVIVNTVPQSQDWGLMLGGLWGGFGLLGGLMSTALQRRMQRRPGSAALSNRADQAIWTGATLILVSLALGAIGHMAFTGDYTAPNFIPGASFAVYGGAMMASSMVAEEKALQPFALFSVAAGLCLSIGADHPWMYFAAAAAALLALAAPGLVLLRQEPRA